MINVENENLKNGYIYRMLVQKIDKLENEIKEILKLINEASNNMKISVKDYVSIIKELQNKADKDLLVRHTEDNELHYIRGFSKNEKDDNTELLLKKISDLEERIKILENK